MTRTHKLIGPIILLLVFFLPVLALSWSGKCVGIQDGDTITVLQDGKKESDPPSLPSSFPSTTGASDTADPIPHEIE